MSGRTSRRGLVPPFIVMEVLKAANERAAQGADVLHLEVGEPGSGAPPRALAAAEAALREARLGYTEALGLPALRRRIARHYGEWYGQEVESAPIAVTAGASGAFILGFLAAFDAGSRVCAGAGLSGLPQHPPGARRRGRAGPGRRPTRFQPTARQLAAIDGPLHGLVLASPANPTGTMLREQDLAALATFCRKRSIRLVMERSTTASPTRTGPGRRSPRHRKRSWSTASPSISA